MSRDRSDRRERRRAGSGTRDAKHRTGGGWTHLDVPEGLATFSPKEGSFKFDVVDYEVGEGNPFAKPGTWYYERTYYVHTNVGPNKSKYVCPAKTANKRCPICEHRVLLAKAEKPDKKLLNSLLPKERQLWLLHFIGKDGEESNGVVLFDYSHHLFGKLLDKCRSDAEDGETHITEFDDPDAGSTLKASFSEEDGGGYQYLDCYKIDFRARSNGMDQDLLDHGFCLDKMVKVLPYDQLKKIFFQEEDDEGDEEQEEKDPPSKKTKSKDEDDWDKEEKPPKKAPPKEKEPEPEPEPEPKKKILTAEEAGLTQGIKVRHRQFGVCELVRISKDGTSLMLMDEKEEVHTAVGCDEVKKVETSSSKKDVSNADESSSPPKDSDTSNAAPTASPSKRPKPIPDDDGWEDDKPSSKGKGKPEPDPDDAWD